MLFALYEARVGLGKLKARAPILGAFPLWLFQLLFLILLVAFVDALVYVQAPQFSAYPALWANGAAIAFCVLMVLFIFRYGSNIRVAYPQSRIFAILFVVYSVTVTFSALLAWSTGWPIWNQVQSWMV